MAMSNSVVNLISEAAGQLLISGVSGVDQDAPRSERPFGLLVIFSTRVQSYGKGLILD